MTLKSQHMLHFFFTTCIENYFCYILNVQLLKNKNLSHVLEQLIKQMEIWTASAVTGQLVNGKSNHGAFWHWAIHSTFTGHFMPYKRIDRRGWQADYWTLAILMPIFVSPTKTLNCYIKLFFFSFQATL